MTLFFSGSVKAAATVVLVSALPLAACSSDDGNGSGGLDSGSGASNGAGAVIGVGGSGQIPTMPGAGTGGSTTGSSDGGLIDLTPEEIGVIEDAACTGWSVEGESLPAAIQLVVDVSGSMEDPAPGTDDDSKWDVTQVALEEAIAGLPASVALGVLYYPNQSTESTLEPQPVEACVNVEEMVPMGLLGDEGGVHRSAVMQSLEDAETGDLTPTHDAYKYALLNGIVPYQTIAPKFMLLITDGAPTKRLECIGESGGRGGGGMVMDQPTEPIIAEVAGAFAQGIRTFIIGSPGSEQSSESNTDMRPWLSAAATAGGTAAAGCSVDGPNFCHMDMTQEPDFAAALTAGLAAVVGQVVNSCTFEFPQAPPGETIDPLLTSMIVAWGDGSTSLVLRDDNGSCVEGWEFDADGNVSLCSATCDRAKADAGATVRLTFGCDQADIVPVR
jgi:hypothetical protein